MLEEKVLTETETLPSPPATITSARPLFLEEEEGIDARQEETTIKTNTGIFQHTSIMITALLLALPQIILIPTKSSKRTSSTTAASPQCSDTVPDCAERANLCGSAKFGEIMWVLKQLTL